MEAHGPTDAAQANKSAAMALDSIRVQLCSTEESMRGMSNSWLAWATIALIRRRW